jgi:hypothetical protein
MGGECTRAAAMLLRGPVARMETVLGGRDDSFFASHLLISQTRLNVIARTGTAWRQLNWGKPCAFTHSLKRSAV